MHPFIFPMIHLNNKNFKCENFAILSIDPFPPSWWWW